MDETVGPSPGQSATAVIDRLIASLPAGRVITGEDVSPKYGTDASRYPVQRPAALLLPQTTQEVSAILQICHRAHQPVVAQGGLTGTNAGAQPGVGELAMCLEKMSGVESIDEAGIMVVKAGTPLQTVQEAARDAGWLCGIDIGARGSCTIGGNVATNAGGNCVIRYGMTRDNVLGLEVVLADGQVLQSLNKMRKNTSGYDLKQLFVGSEGTLGVVTRVALQLHPLPITHECAFVAVTGYPAALRLMKRAQMELAGGLTSFEVMWPDYYDFMLEKVKLAAPLAGRHPLYLLLDVQGVELEGDRERLATLLGELMETGDVVDAAIATSDADVTRLWRIREEVSELRQHMPHRSVFDVSFPIARMQEVVDDLRDAIGARWPGAISLFFGHIGDGNVHIIVALPDHEMHASALDELVFSAVRDYEGAVAAEHGIGRKRRSYLSYCRTEEEIALMRLLKRSLDPHSILNPNKVI